MPVPLWEQVGCRYTLLYGQVYLPEHSEGCSLQLFYHTKPNEQENYPPPFRFNKQITDSISHEIYCLLAINISKNGPPPYPPKRTGRQGFASIYFNNKNRSAIAFIIAVADPFLFSIQYYLLSIILLASGIRHLHFAFRISHSICHLPLAISHLQSELLYLRNRYAILSLSERSQTKGSYSRVRFKILSNTGS